MSPIFAIVCSIGWRAAQPLLSPVAKVARKSERHNASVCMFCNAILQRHCCLRKRKAVLALNARPKFASCASPLFSRLPLCQSSLAYNLFGANLQYNSKLAPTSSSCGDNSNLHVTHRNITSLRKQVCATTLSARNSLSSSPPPPYCNSNVFLCDV